MTALALLVSFAALFFAPAQKPSTDSAALASMEQKLQRIATNGAAQHPDQTPTVITEQEANAYLASGKASLPQGVRSVRLQGQPGVVIGTTQVDFDRLKAGQDSSNPLLSVFSGVHEVVVNADAHGSGGQGVVHVNSVAIDGVDVPRFALQLFIEKYIQPQYPEVGLDSRFALPDRIDTAVVGLHKLTITQK